MLDTIFFIFLSDLFLIIKETEFASYADDNTLSDVGNSIEDATLSLQDYSNGFPKIKCIAIPANNI